MTVLWFRRDLRLADHPALVAAAAAGPVVPLFVLDPALLGPAGGPRTVFLFRCLRALDESLGGRLVVRTGDPVDVVAQVASEADADPAPSLESAATKASWGTSTRPTIFIRFLPSFCFSSSLRLRVMSPP